MKLIYCIMAYNDPGLLARTINRLKNGDTHFLIHVQKSVDIVPFKSLIPEMYFIPEKDRIETIWGDISCVKAALLLFKTATQLYGCEGGGITYCLQEAITL